MVNGTPQQWVESVKKLQKKYSEYSKAYGDMKFPPKLNDKQTTTLNKALETLPGGLSAFLIQPVQRVGRYVLLLQDLQKKTAKAPDETPSQTQTRLASAGMFANAHKAMEKTGLDINRGIKLLEAYDLIDNTAKSKTDIQNILETRMTRERAPLDNLVKDLNPQERQQLAQYAVIKFGTALSTSQRQALMDKITKPNAPLPPSAQEARQALAEKKANTTPKATAAPGSDSKEPKIPNINREQALKNVDTIIKNKQNKAERIIKGTDQSPPTNIAAKIADIERKLQQNPHYINPSSKVAPNKGNSTMTFSSPGTNASNSKVEPKPPTGHKPIAPKVPAPKTPEGETPPANRKLKQ